MGYCPSQDWDHYINEQDDQAAAEVAWWQENKDRVLKVACAFIANQAMTCPQDPENLEIKKLIEISAKVVIEITQKAEPL